MIRVSEKPPTNACAGTCTSCIYRLARSRQSAVRLRRGRPPHAGTGAANEFAAKVPDTQESDRPSKPNRPPTDNPPHDAEQKSYNMALLIAQDHEVNEAHAARFRAIQAMWQHAYAAGLTPNELHALDMALMHGADPPT